MNDRFKFRVWDKGNKRYQGSDDWLPLIDKDGDVCFHNIDGVLEYPPENNYFIIEQCTGLKDKNGNLIYEGDIIHEVDKEADIDDVSQIVWNQDTCHFMMLDLPDTKLNRHCLICEADSPYIEIIGNIHEQNNDTEAD